MTGESEWQRWTPEQRQKRVEYRRKWRQERDAAVRELVARHRREYLHILSAVREETEEREADNG